MLTSSTAIRVLASATTRESMPSYRPQAKIRCRSPAYWAAISWVNGVPDGVGTIRRDGRGGAAPEAVGAEVESGAGVVEVGAWPAGAGDGLARVEAWPTGA